MSMVNGEMVTALNDHTNNLLDLIREDYSDWSELCEKYDGASESRKKIKDEMIEDFNQGLTFEKGRKYLKIISSRRNGQRCVWGFVVASTDDKKFQFGDILKAGGWAAPARNFSRGNVFKLGARRFRWAGCI
tara:strand:+ start:151 stop:546 length:396 start_codon:yes stop_codon:yes gene_type:complete